jgi:transposase, IS5 family
MRKIRFKKHTSDSFFGHYLYDQILDKNHFLVKTKKIINWQRFSKRCLVWYRGAAETGRPPYNPSVLLKMLFISYLYNFSERETETIINDSLSMKYFLGLGVDESAPDHSSLTYFKERLIKGGSEFAFDQLLLEILYQAQQNGIKFGHIQIVDSVHTEANVNLAKDKKRKDQGQKPRDPGASWGTKGKRKINISNSKNNKTKEINRYFFGYKTFYSRNSQNGLVTAVRTTTGKRYDGHSFKRVVQKDAKTKLLSKKRTYSADKGFDSGDNHFFLEEEKLGDAICLRKTRLNKKDKNKEIWQKLVRTKQYKKGQKERYRIEQLNGEAKERHGLRRCRYLGLKKFHLQATITAMVINLKVVVAVITGSTLKGYGYQGNAVWLRAP